MRNRLFTIFGGTGFIGRYVVERLADRGARILVISRSPRSRGVHLQPLGAVGQIVVQSADLSSETALRRAVAGAAGAVNLIVTVGRDQDPARFGLSCTVTGPVRVAAGARRGERGENVYESNTSLFFKETRVHRFLDEERGVVVYMAWSTKLVDGSPYNAVAVVPIR